MTRVPTSRRLLALGAALLAAGSMSVTVPVLVGAAETDEGTGTGAAGQTVTVTPVDGLDPAGETVTVTGAGFGADAGFDPATDGLLVALCVVGEEGVAPGPCVGGLDPADGTGATGWVTNDPVPGTPSAPVGADGSFATTLTVRPADVVVDCTDLHDGQRCAVVVRTDHRAADDRTQDVAVPVTFGPPRPDGTTTTTTTTEPVPVPAPAVGGGTARADAVATTTSLIIAPTTVAAGTKVTATATVETADTETPVTSGTVELFDGTTSLGTASLGPGGRATRPATFASAGAHPVTARFTGTDAAAASTSDPVVVTVTAPDPGPDPDPDPDPDETPSGTRTGTGVGGQTLTATPVDDLDPDGTEVEVTGAGFTGAAGFDIDEGGLYVSFCVDNGAGAQPSPCVGGVDVEGSSGASQWVTNNPYQGAPAVPIADDGSFTATITVSARDEFVDCLELDPGTRCVIVSRVDHRGTADRSQDVKVPVCFAGEARCAIEPIDPSPSGDTPPPFGGYPLPSTGSTGSPGTTGGYSPLAGGTGGLAATGFAGRALVPVGAALVAAGAALVLVGRRRAVPTP